MTKIVRMSENEKESKNVKQRQSIENSEHGNV
jgi:hypothetical protein